MIAELATRLGELHRENAILKVQVALYQEAATASAAAPAVPPVPTPVSTVDTGVLGAPTLD